MTLPAANPTLQSLVHYVATAVPTTDYTFTPTPLPTSWDLAGYLNAPPAPSFPAWISAIPDTEARSKYSKLIEQLESDSVSLGRLATAGTINGTLFPGIVPAKATGLAGGVAAVSQIADGQVQAPPATAPAAVTATTTMVSVSTAMGVSTTTTTMVSVSTAAGVSSVAAGSSVAAVSGNSTVPKPSVATYAPGANAAVSVGMSLGAAVVAGVVGVAALM